MRLSLSAATALLLASSGPLAFVSASDSANVDAEPKPDTIPEATPTKTTQRVAARETPPNIIGAIWQIANNFQLRACVPGVLPLVTTLPKIPPGLIGGDAINQALSQTTRELSEVCDFSITGPPGSVFTSFLPTWYSWYDRYSDRLQSIITKCPKASQLVSTIEAYTTCSQVQAQLTAVPTTDVSSTTTSAADTGSGGDVPTPTETTESDSHSAARETGFLGAAAAAAAGVLGVVAVL